MEAFFGGVAAKCKGYIAVAWGHNTTSYRLAPWMCPSVPSGAEEGIFFGSVLPTGPVWGTPACSLDY